LSAFGLFLSNFSTIYFNFPAILKHFFTLFRRF
jgi:hypothetical protein